MRFGAALLFCLMSTTASAQEFATVTTNAPIYAAAQETPTPLRVAAVGSRLRVLATEQDWVQVEYNDPQLGRSVGWVLRHYVSLTSHDLRPMDLSVPGSTSTSGTRPAGRRSAGGCDVGSFSTGGDFARLVVPARLGRVA